MTGHNHYTDCSCGWCSGGYRGSSSRACKPVEIGQEWSSKKPATYVSYVDHNARCPVCGQNVFFYQSPHGGRVFFDEPGWPWPKHGCTDTYWKMGANAEIKPAQRWSLRFRPSNQSTTGWRPFVYLKKIEMPRADRFWVDPQHVPVGRKAIYLPKSMFGHAPMSWRKSDSRFNFVEISSIQVEKGNVKTIILSTPTFAVNDRHFYRLSNQGELTPEELNSLGKALSFDIIEKHPKSWQTHPDLNLAEARRAFQEAAHLGYWRATYNLGVMALHGIGTDIDPKAAFELFKLASQEMDDLPLDALRECYTKGIGTEIDLGEAEKIDDFLAHRAEEQPSK